MKKTTFALFFGNRGFFPASLQAQAREELPRVLKALGHDVLMLDAEATRYGVSVVSTELVGPVPLDALEEILKFYLQVDGFSMNQIIETALLD